MRAARAGGLVNEILAQLTPHFPAGVQVEATVGKRAMALQRILPGDARFGSYSVHLSANGGSFGKEWVPAFGTWIPFLPRALHARLVAQDIVETLLRVASEESDKTATKLDFDVQARVRNDLVIVSYRPNGSPTSPRVELRPISVARLNARSGGDE